MPRCDEVMTKDPVCCSSGDSVRRAAEIMKKEDVGSVPVVEAGTKRLVGIVTDRDLALKIVAEGCDAGRTTVGDVMTRELVTCAPEDPLDQALEMMAEHQVRRIPVVDASDCLLGIIAQADIATRVEGSEEVGEVVEAISEPAAK